MSVWLLKSMIWATSSGPRRWQKPMAAAWAVGSVASMLELESMSIERAIGCGSRAKNSMFCFAPSSVTVKLCASRSAPDGSAVDDRDAQEDRVRADVKDLPRGCREDDRARQGDAGCECLHSPAHAGAMTFAPAGATADGKRAWRNERIGPRVGDVVARAHRRDRVGEGLRDPLPGQDQAFGAAASRRDVTDDRRALAARDRAEIHVADPRGRSARARRAPAEGRLRPACARRH